MLIRAGKRSLARLTEGMGCRVKELSKPMTRLLIARKPRCGARTRSGRPCQLPPVTGKTRCRMHGGAAGSGAPTGNKNALKHGRYTAEAIAWRRDLRTLIRENRRLVKTG